MKTTKRFDNAVSKLYNAFHNGDLEAEDCRKCAVGNICNGSGTWWNIIQNARPKGYDSYLEKCKMPLAFIPAENYIMKSTGYSSTELARIESLFMLETIEETKETQFNGLCAVIEYLCELDNIPNVIDYTKLFETENDKPKYQLS